MQVGDYVYDWELGLWGLILETRSNRRRSGFILLYEDGEKGGAFENALAPEGPTDSCKPAEGVV